MFDESVNDLEQIEISIDSAKKIIEYAEAIERLENNPDFIKVILDDYLDKNIVRLVKVKGDPSQQSEADQKYLNDQLTGAVALFHFINYAKISSNHAKNALEQNSLEREAILAEGN